VDELHEVTNESHHCEANRDRPTYLKVLCLRGLRAPSDELFPFPNKLLGNFDKFSDFVGHGEEMRVQVVCGGGDGGGS